MSAKSACNMANSQTYKIGSKDPYAPYLEGLTPPAQKAFLQAIEKDPWFDYAFRGSTLSADRHLILRLQVSYIKDDAGLWLVYNGHRFSRQYWSWRPPKLIRELGRLAREQPNPRNTHAQVRVLVLTPEGYKPTTLDKCPCGGELIYNEAMELYCTKCGLMAEGTFMPPGYDSLRQSAPMSDHNYDNGPK